MSTVRTEQRIRKILDEIDFNSIEMNEDVPNLRLEIENCVGAHKDIWKDNDLSHFTKHGMEHSLKIYELFKDFEDMYKWSNYEKAMFFVCSLIHDIGMQYNQWATKPTSHGKSFVWQSLNLTEFKPPISHNLVRENHVIFAFSMIEAHYEKRVDWTSPRSFGSGSDSFLGFLYEASAISSAHSGEEYWDKIKNGEEFNNNMYRGDHQSFRPRLLATMLRFCDELDGCKYRVPNPENLHKEDLPFESKIHWLACYFTESVIVDVTSRTISLNWSVDTKSGELSTEIKDFLEKVRLKRILKEYEKCKDMLEKSVGTPENFAFKIQINPTPILKPISYFDSKIEILREYMSNESLSQYSGRNTVIGEKKTFKPSKVMPVSVQNAPVSYEECKNAIEATAKWYRANRTSRHMVLSNNQHTNYFVSSRALVSDVNLNKKIVEYLVNLYESKSIDLVVAVGTSPISFAQNLALRLNISFTSMFPG